MPGIIPSKHSAFRVCTPKTPKTKALPESHPAVKPPTNPPTNPHGYRWRAYTESDIRQTLRYDIQKRNILRSAIQQFDKELKNYGLINTTPKYNRFILLQTKRELYIEHLKQVKHKVDIHADYQLYVSHTL
jgi:hypothetical protein